MLGPQQASALRGYEALTDHSVSDEMRYITSLDPYIRNGGNFPEPACRQRADGEEPWPCLAIRAKQPGIAVDLDTKAKGIEPKHPVRSHAFQKARVADTRAFHAGAIDDRKLAQDLQYSRNKCETIIYAEENDNINILNYEYT